MGVGYRIQELGKMPRYRVHILDGSGKVIGIGQFDCINSRIAQERVKRLVGELDSELWQLVSSSGPGATSSSEVSRAKATSRKHLHS